MDKHLPAARNHSNSTLSTDWLPAQLTTLYKCSQATQYDAFWHETFTDGIRLLSKPILACCGELWPLVCLSFICSPLLCKVLRADTPDEGSLQEVIVTATKRETKLLDTPVSMTVIGSELLQVANVDSFADYARLVPGLTAIDSGPGETRYALRGLQSAGEPEVALYYDEIPISGLPGSALDTGDSQPDLRLWDVDRIEVLRGT